MQPLMNTNIKIRYYTDLLPCCFFRINFYDNALMVAIVFVIERFVIAGESAGI